jgi:hypothetical protein
MNVKRTLTTIARDSEKGESFKAGIFTTGILLLQPEEFTVEQSNNEVLLIQVFGMTLLQ